MGGVECTLGKATAINHLLRPVETLCKLVQRVNGMLGYN
jgi:hypothetical protein